MNKKGIIFDLDGTLWDASTQVVPAWNIVLKRHSELDKQITIDDMRGFMGKRIEVIAEIMFPRMDSEKRMKILEECCNEEQIYLRKHGGILYPKLEETLKLLAQNYSIYIVSNCQDGYVQGFLDYHKLWSYFKDIEMSGRTGKCKGENIKIIIERNEINNSVYVGDTNGDLEGAEYAGIPFIYAAYGFGQLDNVKYSINNISDINKIISSIL
ncbi:HAD family hydrolase [Clostridium tagluense]|uniref:HAD family hydrolase n=1 Tax=Clostridium tagluense TaxID=360422 RepID=UPI001C0B5480|nr:HAD family hydrolase [Clostridium tagluense]MBU3129936.1 HAD family hydrolase [Clostridium tagluense]MCB2311951.1 HAD family hydrolase [Clostridium tagluense]MCB2318138.1 HAD family hydrolase [Clostridium tagluense]MCB2323325.1 HAD family hydrolase [Clostridium tagluense]MCB2327922.1 HAD family hydrolase [Clostridium tagluense]